MTDEVNSGIAALVPRLRRFAYALTGNRDQGDDLVQTACVKALDRRHQFKPGTRLDSWMFRIVQTSFLDDVRLRRRQRPVSDPGAIDFLSDDGQGQRRAESRVDLVRVRREMAALPDEQRVVLILVAIEGFSYRETADTLGVPIGTVMSRLARARSRLSALNQEYAQ
jgi:RNA polymerase sigma-70 factor (ECF subfamily)